MKGHPPVLYREPDGKAAVKRVLSVRGESAEVTAYGGAPAWYLRDNVFRMDPALLTQLVRVYAARDTEQPAALWERAVPWSPSKERGQQ